MFVFAAVTCVVWEALTCNSSPSKPSAARLPELVSSSSSDPFLELPICYYGNSSSCMEPPLLQHRPKAKARKRQKGLLRTSSCCCAHLYLCICFLPGQAVSTKQQSCRAAQWKGRAQHLTLSCFASGLFSSLSVHSGSSYRGTMCGLLKES